MLIFTNRPSGSVGGDGFGWGYSSRSGFEVSRDTSPDIAATQPTWNTAQGGVDFGYTISGANLSKATTAALYWAPDQTFGRGPRPLIKGSRHRPQTAQVAPNTSVPIPISAAVLQDTPEPTGTKYLLAVVNPPGANHHLGLRRVGQQGPERYGVPSVAPTSPSLPFQWHPDLERQHGDQPSRRRWCGLHVYEIVTGADTQPAPTSALYWAKGPTLADKLGAPITEDDNGNPLMTETAQGVHNTRSHVSAARLGTPPLRYDEPDRCPRSARRSEPVRPDH